MEKQIKNKICVIIISNLLYIVAYSAALVGGYRFVNLLCPIESNEYLTTIVPYFIIDMFNNLIIHLLAGSEINKKSVDNINTIGEILKACFIVIIEFALLIIGYIFAINGMYNIICLITPIDLTLFIIVASPFIISKVIFFIRRYLVNNWGNNSIIQIIKDIKKNKKK